MPDSAALSVLVLAWDEAAPTVRTVLEAAPAVGSLLVLLPPPLPAPPPPAARPQPAASSLPDAPPTPLGATPPPPPIAEAAPEGPPATHPAAPPAPQPPTPVAPAATAATAPQATPAARLVRLVRLVASELPATVRSGSFRVPAAPYLGATPSAAAAAEGVAPAQSRPQGLPASLPTPSNLPPAPPTPHPAVAAVTAAVDTLASTPAPAEPTVVVAVMAADLAPAVPTGEVAAEPLAEAAFAANDILDPDPEEELHPGPQPQPTATTPADALQLADTPLRAPAPALWPFGNRLPQADTAPAAPRPAPLAPPASEDTPEELAAGFAASVAAARQYTAPDLNSQVIRYARLAVPTALAAGRYEVIYAPAWPTWLAALELRQRAHLPLVLHLPALAAGRQPADTAAGWPAELQRQVLRQADLVLVETYALARRLRRELGLPTAAVRVVPAHDVAAIARALHRATHLAR